MPAEVERVLAALKAKGLASGTDRTPRSFVATPPDVALLPHIQRRSDSLDQARAAVTDLLETYRAPGAEGTPVS